MAQQRKPCKFYGSAKGCRMGDNCYYNHDNPTSVALCNFYQGNCRNGNNCNFRHNVYKNDSIKPIISNTSELCIYFNSPYGCSRNEKCKFKHIKREQPEQDSTVRLYSMDELCEMKLNLPQREWRNVSPIKKTECIVTISQFNCLAQSLCGGVIGINHLTFKCDQKYLIWEYRCKRILYEILQYKSDIICLQEIDEIHFQSFYYPNLSSMKYDGIFLKKNNIFNGSSQSHISINDGIAIFWNTEKINYLKKKFEFVLGEKSKSAQVALGIRLQLKESKSVIFDVWNTHLKAGRSNENEDKRVKQCKFLIDEMNKYSNNIPIIFCGDLNLHFDDLMNNKGINVNNNAYKLLINHFKSLWNDKVNTFSCYQGWKDRDVVACFDYIMIGNNNVNKNDFFVLKQVLNGWQRNKIEKYQCKLPNKDYPSDHFLIATKIAVQIDKQNNNKNENKKRIFSLIDDDDDGDNDNPSPHKKQRIQ